MKTRTVMWALLAMLAVSFASASKGLDKLEGKDLTKFEPLPEVLPNPSAPPTLPNPSAPPTLPNPSAPPTLPAEDSCLGDLVCKETCAIHKEKHCLNVPVTKKHCTMVPKTLYKEQCEQKCRPLAPGPLAETPNPSAPPADMLGTPLADSAAAADNLLNEHDKSDKLGSRRLQAAMHKKDDKSPEEPKTKEEPREKDPKQLIKVVKVKVAMECQDVCVQVPYIKPEMECVEGIETVEKCTEVPEKNCEKECVCKPEKVKLHTKKDNKDL